MSIMVLPAVKRLAGTKRPAEEDVMITNMEAATTFRRLLLSVPKRLKKQSLYVRFKYIMLQDASVKGEREKIANITELAKQKWKLVKDVNTHDVRDDKENIDAYIVNVKRRAQEEELREEKEHSKVFTEWCERFQAAASAHLTTLATHVNETNYQSLKDAVQKVEGIQEWSEHVPKFHLFALVKAKEELESIQEAVAEKTMVDKLHNATVSELYRHVKDYRELESKMKELDRTKAELSALRETQRLQDKMEQEKDQKLAETLVGDVIKNLEKQMVYVASLQTHSKRIVYQRSGVKPQVFCSAFKIPTGSKKTVISSHKVPCKMLHFGASLKCGNVEVKMVASGVLVATAWYSMHSHPSHALY